MPWCCSVSTATFVVLDAGGTRQLVAAKCGLNSLGLDLRPECTDAGRCAAEKLGVSDKAFFHPGDMRTVPKTVAAFAKTRKRQQLPAPRYGGMFTSIPFWKLETYDAAKNHDGLLEHCGTFAAFVEDMTTSLKSTVEVLAENAWVLVHCGPMRDGGRRCDLPFEIKKILQDECNLELVDEVPYDSNNARSKHTAPLAGWLAL